MHFLNVLPLALGVSSLLIPPQINDDIFQTSELLGRPLAEISLNCNGGCPVFRPASKENKDPYFNPKSSDSKLGADVTIKAGKIFFNEQQIWPRPALPPTLSIKQILNSSNLHEYGIDSMDSLPRIPVSTSLEYTKPFSTLLKHKQDKVDNSYGKMIIHPILIEIMAVGSQVVQAERVELQVVENKASAFIGLLHPVTILPYQPSPLIDSCTNIWCRVRGTLAIKYNEWRKAIANKVKGWRKCGQKAGHKMGHNTGVVALKGGPNKFGPGSTLHRHGRHHHRHSRGFFNILFRVVQIVFPPLILGFSIGMLVRAILYRIIPRMQRGGPLNHGEYVEVKQSDIEEGRDSVDGPPKYEEVYGDELPEKEDEQK